MMRPSNGERVRISDVKVIGFEKRKQNANKNLEFVLRVKWSNGEEKSIARQYSMFFDLQGGLKLIFKDLSKITIPDLPVPKFPGVALFSSVAKKESRVIEEFCLNIIHLPSAVSESDIVEKFFSVWGTDIIYKDGDKKTMDKTMATRKHSSGDQRSDLLVEKYRAVASYQASTKGEMGIDENEVLTVIEKNQTGWWLVTNDKGQHGFAPATFLEPLDQNRENESEQWLDYDGEPRLWVSIQPYTAQGIDEVTYEKGEQMELIATSRFGWWKVRYQGQVGITPASNLKPKEQAFDNPVYYCEPTSTDRRASFTSVGPTYASIRRPPPRRDSANKKDNKKARSKPDNLDIGALEYAVVHVSSSHPSSPTSPEPSDKSSLYSYVVPKHLRPVLSKNSSSPDLEIEKIKEDTGVDQPPAVPPCLVQDTDEQSSEPTERRHSAEEVSGTQGHGYLNVNKGGLANGCNLYKAIVDYTVPPDRQEDLPLQVGCIVKALSKDGGFFCVSTLDEPPRLGWVPEHVLASMDVNAKSNSANRRSMSLGDIIPAASQPVSDVIAVKRAPVAAPRTDKRRFQSFDSTGSSTTEPADNALYEMSSEIESFRLQSTLADTEPWFRGKMKRQTCEDIMLKKATELDYLVRESTQKFASYVLSVKFSGKIRHFPIETTPSKKFVIGKHAFDSLPEIITFYSKHPLFYTQNKEPVSLGQPFISS